MQKNYTVISYKSSNVKGNKKSKDNEKFEADATDQKGQ